MELSLKNLDEIHEVLQITHEGSQLTLACINFNETLEPTPEKRKFLNLLMEQIGGYLIEVSHINSFLQYCDITKEPLTAEQHKTVMACQQLCQTVKKSSQQIFEWIVKTKAQFNEAACPVPEALEAEAITIANNDGCVYSIQDEVEVTSIMLDAYQQFRDIFKEIHADVLYMDAENMMNTSGRRLDVMQGKKIFIETEQEMNVVIDYGLFQYRKDKKNVPERYYDMHHKLYSGKKLQALKIFKETQFSFLQILKPVEEHGILVKDELANETLLVVDRGMHQLALTKKNYAVLTHYFRTPEFVMTTGASIPVSLDTEIGKKMWGIFERLVRHHQKNAVLNIKDYYQCITDLFKTAIHENLVKSVASPVLPMNYYQTYEHGNMH